jgi:FkbM family methyltransferase
MRLLTRAVGAASRRARRPEWLAAVDAHARQSQREEVGIRAALAALLGDGATYVDVGANRGQVLREAVRVGPRARHIAFEPVPGLADAVEQAFPQVECRRLALGARSERARFCHFTRLEGWSGLRRNPEVSDARGRPVYIDVQVSTLDAELAEVTPSVVKIDVEGAELAVLEGGRELLARARPVVIFEHVAQTSALYGAAPQAPWDLLAEFGYAVFAVTGEGPCTRAEFATASGVVNWLARPPAAPLNRGTGA